MEENMYYFNYPSFISSGLKTIDSHLLEFARRYADHAVSAVWIQQFTAFLKHKQAEYIKLHPRVKPVDIHYEFRAGDRWSKKRAWIHCGGFNVTLPHIPETHQAFEEPPLL